MRIIMKHILIMFVAVGAFLLLLPSFSSAQYYGYYSPYYAVPPPVPAAPGQEPLRYRLGADPLLYWKWNRHNAFSDYLEYQRSPENPESDLSYMLRTF
jgi:hypothetical protein